MLERMPSSGIRGSGARAAGAGSVFGAGGVGTCRDGPGGVVIGAAGKGVGVGAGTGAAAGVAAAWRSGGGAGLAAAADCAGRGVGGSTAGAGARRFGSPRAGRSTGGALVTLTLSGFSIGSTCAGAVAVAVPTDASS